MKKKNLSAIFLALCVQFVTSTQAAPVSAFEMSSSSGFTNGSWALGEVFTVGTSNLLATSLGAFDQGGNGFATNGGISVGLFLESSHSLLASTHVLSSDALIGHYRFSDIADIVLNANTQYRVVAVSGNDQYTSGATGQTTDPRLTWESWGYCSAITLTSCDAFSGTTLRHFMGNLQIDAAPNNVPEPGSLALFGLSVLALTAARKRKQA